MRAAMHSVEPASPGDYPLLIGQLLANLPQFAEQEIVSEGQRFTYDTFARRIHRLAHLLTGMGVKPGMVVAVMDWDSHRYLEAYFAVPMMGAVLQTVNVRLAPAQIAFTLRQTGAQLLIHHADFAELVAGIMPALSPAPQFIAVEGYEAGLAVAPDEDFAFPLLDENSLATRFHTTGTSGDPKAVGFTHRQLVLHTMALAGTLANQPYGEGFRRGDVYMPMTPMFHVHAWGMPYLATMMGAKQVYPGRYEPARLLALQREEGVTFSHCVPTILRMLLDAIPPEAPPLPRWTMIIGGSALHEDLRRQALERGIVALGGYGMSETGPVVAVSRSEGARSDPALLCRAGYPVPLVWVRSDTDGPHELQFRAPWLTRDYNGDPAASRDLWREGWLHTQDVGAIGPDGAITIADRMKDMIKSGGEWVSSLALEALCLTHPALAEVAVIGMPDQRWGERPVLFAVPLDATVPPDIAEIRTLLQPAVEAGAISRYALPDRLIAIKSLPRTSVGKIDKKRLKAFLKDDQVIPKKR